MKAFFVQTKCELGKSYAVATAIAGIRDTTTIIMFRAF